MGDDTSVERMTNGGHAGVDAPNRSNGVTSADGSRGPDDADGARGAEPAEAAWRGALERLFAPLLRMPLFYKVLIANSAIVLLGALVGTAVTLRVGQINHDGRIAGPLAATFAIVGLALSGALNALILRAALTPLSRLQAVVRRVQVGDLSARAQPSPLDDREIAQLAETLNATLDEVQRYEEQARALSGRVISAQEEERQRIARELHDDTGQVLTLLLIRLKLLEAQPGGEALHGQIAELRALVSSSIDRVRQLALNLRPPTLDQLGLVPALRSLVATYTENTHIAVKLETPREPVRLSPEQTIAVYRVAQEALTNIAKHAGARNVTMNVTLYAGELWLEIRDDGKGFAPGDYLRQPRTRSPQTGPGVGLFGMEERARLAGGALTIASAPGRGAAITLRVPLDSTPPALRPTPDPLADHADHADHPAEEFSLGTGFNAQNAHAAPAESPTGGATANG